MTLVSVLGVATGVAALIIVLSVMGGFEQDIYQRLFRGLPHLEVTSKHVGTALSLQEFPIDGMTQEAPGLTGVEPFTQADVVLKQNRHMVSATLFGIDEQRGGKLWGFGTSLTQGDMSSLPRLHKPVYSSSGDKTERPGIILGENLALQLSADIGDEINVISPQANIGSVLGGGTLSRKYVLVGMFMTGQAAYDGKWAVVTLPEGRKFLPDYDESFDEGAYVSGVAMRLDDPYQATHIAQRIEQSLDLKTVTWQTTNKSLLTALKLEKFAMGSVLMLIVLVAAFSISGTMMMTVFYKRGQVAILRALGMTRRHIIRLFLTHGITIGSLGVVGGLLLGLTVCKAITWMKFLELPRGIYQLRHIPVKFLPIEYGVICGLALLLALLAAIYPAFMASRQDPTTGLRYE